MKGLWVAMLAVAVMTSCKSAPEKSAPKAQPPESKTGRVAFQEMYVAARGWALDAQPFQLTSEINADSKGQGGKSETWRASFASPMKRSAKSYVWSGTEGAGEIERGVNPGTEDSYNPGNTSTLVFDIAFLKNDSDKAFETGQKHGGDKLIAQAPDTPVIYTLDWDRNSNELIWHVIYGATRDDAKLRVALDATTGDFIRVEQ